MDCSDFKRFYRAEQELNVGPSFTTISAFGANSAVIHYTPTPETDAQINTSSLFLGKKIVEIWAKN